MSAKLFLWQNSDGKVEGEGGRKEWEEGGGAQTIAGTLDCTAAGSSA
jgi:hypothetical protein